MPRNKAPKARLSWAEKGMLIAAGKSGNSRVAGLSFLASFCNAPDADYPGPKQVR